MVCCLIGCQGNLALYIGSSQCKLENALRLYKTCTILLCLDIQGLAGDASFRASIFLVYKPYIIFL